MLRMRLLAQHNIHQIQIHIHGLGLSCDSEASHASTQIQAVRELCGEDLLVVGNGFQKIYPSQQLP